MSGPNTEGFAGAKWTTPEQVPPLHADLLRRLYLAERFCMLWHRSESTRVDSTPEEKARTQAFLDWYSRYGLEARRVSTCDVAELIRRREKILNRGKAYLDGDPP